MPSKMVFYRLCVALFLCILFVAPNLTPFLIAQESSNVTLHVVQRGENLFGIAQLYGVTVETLVQLNGITDPGNLLIGQRLLVPVANAIIGNPETHVVQPGETLGTISALYGLTLDDLAALNGINDINTVYVGQVLALAPPQSVPLDTAVPESAAPVDPSFAAPLNVSSVVIHTVSAGETVFRIATQYGSSVNAIVEANGLADASVIFAGQTLVIPDVQPPAVPELPAPLTGVQIMPLVFIEGQTGMIRLTANAAATINGSFLDRALQFAIEGEGARLTALVGIPLGTPGGIYPLTLDVNGVVLVINIQVVGGSYRQESLTLLADRSNLLDPVVDDAELNLLRGIMSPFNPSRIFDGIFGLPAAATITSPFGAVRQYNGGEVRTHLGTDFGGVPGTPILAPASGVVVLADTLNVRGVATVIDHGWGVYTGYWHQTERYVGVGETITAGQVIGSIGSSGRVSGPHLHWELWVNGTPVEPMQWVLLSFS